MSKIQTKAKRQKRVRAKMTGTQSMPRLSVHRTNAHVFAQLIDDENGKTLLGISESKEMKGTKTEKAKQLGILLAKKAKSAKVTSVVFDRGSFRYHGRVKALAEGAREGGLEF